MKTSLSVIALIGLFGCGSPDLGDTGGSNDTGVPNDTSTPQDTNPTDTTDSGTPITGEGSVALIHSLDDAEFSTTTMLYGVFSDSNQGLISAASCIGTTICLSTTPSAIDTLTETGGSLGVGFDFTASNVGNIGSIIQLGGFEAPIQPDNSYNGPTSVGFVPSTVLDLRFAGGAWGAYNGVDSITTPSVFSPISPNPAEHLSLVSDASVTFNWATPGDGDVVMHLILRSKTYSYQLEDDGTFELNLADINFPEGVNTALVTIGRQNTAIADVNGATVDLIARSEQFYYIDLINVGNRVLIDPVNTCSGAQSDAPLAAGSYFGYLTGTTSAFNPACAADATAAGPEGFVKVEIPASSIANFTYEMPSGEPAVYLVTDCADESSCLVGDVPDTLWGSGIGQLEYYNDSDAPITAYIGFDSVANGGLFTFDFEFTSVQSIQLADTCDALAGISPIGEGLFYGSLASLNNDYDETSSSSCTGEVTKGPDGLIPVSIPDGTLFSAEYDLFDDDASIYLITDCADVSGTCLTGLDDSSFSPESFSFLNDTGSTIDGYLVFDARDTLSGNGAFSVTTALRTVNPAHPADTCADVGTVPNLTTGSYVGDLSALTPSFNPGGTNGCTGYTAEGADGVFPVELLTGQTLDVTYGLDKDGSLYLSSDCADEANTCLVGADDSVSGTETISYSNSSGATQTLYLIIDHYTSSGTQAGAYTLDVTLQ